MKGIGGFFQTKKAESDPYGQLNPEQRALLGKVGPYLQSQIGQAQPQYTGDFTAPISDQEQTLIDQTSRMNALAEQGYSNLLKGEFPEDYYQQSIYKPMLKQYQEDIQPLIEEQYAGSGGYWGGARAGAVGKGYRDLMDTLASKRAELAYQAKRDVMEAGPSYASYAKGAQEMFQIPRLIKQYGLDQRYNEWVRTRPESQQYINQALDFLGLSTGTQTPGEKSMFDQLIPELVKSAATKVMSK